MELGRSLSPHDIPPDIGASVEIDDHDQDNFLQSLDDSNRELDELVEWALVGSKRRPKSPEVISQQNKKIDLRKSTDRQFSINPLTLSQGLGIVLIESINGTANRLVVARQLILHNVHFISIRAQGRNRVRVEFLSVESASFFLARTCTEDQIFPRNEYKVYIPFSATNTRGIIRGIHASIGEPEILEEALSPIPISKVERISIKQDGGIAIPTHTVVLTFSGTGIPDNIIFYGQKIHVEPYVDRVRVCFNCSRFGHIASQCRAKARCYKCGGAHEGVTCTAVSISCPNCKGEHWASDRACPRLQDAQKARSQKAMSSKAPPKVNQGSAEPPPSQLERPAPTTKSLTTQVEESALPQPSTSRVEKPAPPLSYSQVTKTPRRTQKQLKSKPKVVKKAKDIPADKPQNAQMDKDHRAGMIEKLILYAIKALLHKCEIHKDLVDQMILPAVEAFFKSNVYNMIKGQIFSGFSSSTEWI